MEHRWNGRHWGSRCIPPNVDGTISERIFAPSLRMDIPHITSPAFFRPTRRNIKTRAEAKAADKRIHRIWLNENNLAPLLHYVELTFPVQEKRQRHQGIWVSAKNKGDEKETSEGNQRNCVQYGRRQSRNHKKCARSHLTLHWCFYEDSTTNFSTKLWQIPINLFTLWTIFYFSKASVISFSIYSPLKAPGT